MTISMPSEESTAETSLSDTCSVGSIVKLIIDKLVYHNLISDGLLLLRIIVSHVIVIIASQIKWIVSVLSLIIVAVAALS